MKRLLVSIAILIGVAGGGAYVYFQPHLTMYHIIVAARSGDDQALREAVDFPNVREHLKASLTQQMLKEMASTNSSDNPFAALGVLFAQKIVDTMIDAMVTPAMLTQSVRNAVQLDEKDSAPNWQVLLRVLDRLPGRYSNASTYTLPLAPEGEAAPVTFILQRSLLTFRLTRIDLDLSNAKKRTAKNDRESPAVPAIHRPREEPVITPKETSNWLVITNRSPVDDAVTERAWRESDDPVPTRFGSVRPTLNVVCEPNGELELYVDAKRILEYKYETGHSKIRLRFDQSPPESSEWSTSKDHEAVFSPRPRDLIQRILSAQRLVVELNPVSEMPEVAIFTLAGLAEKFPRATSNCGRKEAARPIPREAVKPAEPQVPPAIESVRNIEPERSKMETDIAPRPAIAETHASPRKSIDDWMARIHAKIKGRVVVPPNIAGNPEARFEVILLPGGEVLSAHLKNSSGNPAYDAAVERAINASQPLPVPEDTDQFQENFRELNMTFRPKD